MKPDRVSVIWLLYKQRSSRTEYKDVGLVLAWTQDLIFSMWITAWLFILRYNKKGAQRPSNTPCFMKFQFPVILIRKLIWW